MTNNSGSRSGKCGCGGDSDKKKDPCPSPKSDKSGTSKTPCKPPAGAKGKCHESHEDFKKKHTDSCSSAADRAKAECSNSYQEFARGIQGDSACGGSAKSECECHDSYKAFQESTRDDCSSSHNDVCEEEQYCKESTVKSVPCPEQTEHDPCSRSKAKPCSAQMKLDPCSSPQAKPCSAQPKNDPCSSPQAKPCSAQPKNDPCSSPKAKPCSAQPKNDPCSSSQAKPCSAQTQHVPCSRSQAKPCSAQPKHDPCSGSVGKAAGSHGSERGCQSQNKMGSCSSASPCDSRGKSDDSSLYSKITSRCKNIAKDFIRPKPRNKCSGTGESSKKVSICNQTAPQGLPCPPKTEKGVGYSPPCCTSKVTCPQSKGPSWSDFFPLDARNQKLNACIDKYMKIDPSQVISKCSQFANKTMDTGERCMEQVRETQQRCRQGVKDGTESAKKSAALISARSRVLMGRWAPSAAMYLATSALVTLYLTEWKAVPVYTDDDTDKQS